MKNINLLLLFFAFNSWAVVDGTPVNWDENDNIIRFDSESKGKLGQCSGIAIAGSYVITAAHCLYNVETLDTITTANSKFKKSDSSYILHPNFNDEGDSSSGEDVAIIKLNRDINYRHINFIFNLNNNPFNYGETIEINGFGGTNGVLNKASLKMTDWRDCEKCTPRGEYSLNAEMFNESHTTGGDSGSAWINTKGEIVSTHKGSSLITSQGDEWRETYSTNLHYAKDFILENINSWHYPTSVITNGKATITVQSLHKDNISDSAYTAGNLILITEESTCINNSISPFEKCTYVVEGDSGELFISNNESIKVESASGGENSDSDSGGSLSFLSLLFCGLIIFRRRK